MFRECLLSGVWVRDETCNRSRLSLSLCRAPHERAMEDGDLSSPPVGGGLIAEAPRHEAASKSVSTVSLKGENTDFHSEKRSVQENEKKLVVPKMCKLWKARRHNIRVHTGYSV